MSRSAALRARRAAVAAGATKKDPVVYQPSRRAAQIRASVAEDISAMRTQIAEHRRHVSAKPAAARAEDAELEARAPWLAEAAHGLEQVLNQRHGAPQQALPLDTAGRRAL